MPLIPEQLLDEIQARADIAELIGRYVPLKRAGRHFKALCPFHKERTPSFHVNTDRQIFHCFGCGVGGNIFSFLMQQERLTFPEAVRQLAEQVGVTIPASPEAMRDGKTTKLLELLEKTCRYYERLLAHPRLGRAAREYLKTRGMTERARQAFHLGCSPSTWDGLVLAAKRSQTPLDLLEQAGLVIRTSRSVVDRFRQRLMFPIQDSRGRVVGFGGRSLANQEPKYLNSPETPVYRKGRQLFGLFQAKDAIVKAKAAIVVEGYFDCVFLWQAGVQHVVSPLGTALTPEQARLLVRYTDSVTLAFDADAAGEAASLRGIDVLVEAGMHVHVAQLPSGVDPDEFVRAYGTQALKELLATSASVVEFLIGCATRRFNIKDPEEKVQAAQWILPTIAKVRSAILRKEYARLLADRFALDEAAVLEELGKVKPRVFEPRLTAEPRTPRQGAERLFAALILDEPTRWDAVKDEQFLGQITDGSLRRILQVLCEMRATDQPNVTPAQVISRLAGEEPGGLVSELVELAQSVQAKEEAFRDCCERLLSEARKRHLANLQEQIRTAQRLGHDQDVARLLAVYQRMVKAT